MVLGNALGKEVGGVYPSSLLLLIKELLVVSSLLAGMSGSSLLAGMSRSGLQAGASGVLIEELLAMALFRPHIVNGPLPGLVGAFRAGVGRTKRGSPQQGWRQQPSGLLVFAECALMPYLPWKGGTNAGQGVVGLVGGKQPVGGPGGRLQLFNLQPLFMIREGGRGQMSRQGSTVPHGVVVGSVHLVRVPT
jgi:hypothetical protein